MHDLQGKNKLLYKCKSYILHSSSSTKASEHLAFGELDLYTQEFYQTASLLQNQGFSGEVG